MPPKLVPVDDDPFATESPPPVGKLVPVDHDPFAPVPKSYAAADVPLEAANNFLPDLGDTVANIGKAAITPSTYDNLAKLGRSPIANPLAVVALMLSPHLPESMRSKVQEMAKSQLAPTKAIFDDYKNAYGDWDSIKRTAAEHPVRVLSDLSIPLTGGSAAASKVGMLGKTLNVAGKIADVPALAANGLGKTAEVLATQGLGKTTGAGATAISEAARTGFYGGEAGADFREALKAGASTDDIVGLAKEGVQTMKDKMLAKYQAAKDDPTHGWAGDPTTLDFQPITDSWKKLRDSYLTRSGKVKVGDSEWNQIQGIGETVADWEKDPASHTVEGLDGLKQRLQDFADPKGAHPQVLRASTNMANAVKDEIVKQAPGYAEAMKNYSVASKHLKDMTDAFSLGRNASAQTAMSKLQSVMRNDVSTIYGHRTEKAAQLENEGLVSLLPKLAGHSLNSWTPRGIAGGMLGGFAPAGAAAAFTGMSLPTAGGAVAGIAAMSPRLMGNMSHLAGRAAGLPFRAGRLAGAYLPEGYHNAPIDAMKAPFSYPARQAYRIEGEEDPEQRARGGYFAGRG